MLRFGMWMWMWMLKVNVNVNVEGECEYFTVTSIDSLLVYKNKYYQQIYLDNCAYKIENKQMADYLDDNIFEDQILEMLYYKKIDTSEGIDPTKSNRSKEWMICYYWFFNHGFKLQDSVYNGCHDLTTLCLNISDIAVIIDKNVDCCCIQIWSNWFIKKFCSWKSWVYVKNIVLIFSLH